MTVIPAEAGIQDLENWVPAYGSRGRRRMFLRFVQIPRALVLAVLDLYRLFLRPLLPPSCRFWPSCSDYAAEAVKKHGALAGTALALKRIARCHPFHPGGVDPVPAGSTSRNL